MGGPKGAGALLVPLTYYVLYYTPHGVDRSGSHTLQVRVKQEGAEVRARRAYMWR